MAAARRAQYARGGSSAPRIISRVKPRYTDAARQAKIEGVVVLACVVEVDGAVGPVRVARSLDAVSGLDDEAVNAAKAWRFTPATKDGAAVRMLVTVQLNFRLDSPVLAWPEPMAGPDGPVDRST